VRTLVVVTLDEVVKALLLLEEIVARRFGGLFLEGQVHALVAAVLLRVTGLDPFDGDPEPQPPDGELAKAEQGMGAGEGHAVIGADGTGQAKLFKNPLKYSECAGFFSGFEALTGQQVAGPVVGDRQRITVLLVAQQELALEVGTPQPIGRLGIVELCTLGLVAPTLAALDQAVAVQHGVDGADGGRLDHGIQLDQFVADLRGTPGAVFLPDPDDGLLDLERQLVGMAVGASRPVLEPTNAAVLVPIEDLVAGLSRNTKIPAHHGHFLALEDSGHKSESFVHTVTLFPGHLEVSSKCRIV